MEPLATIEDIRPSGVDTSNELLVKWLLEAVSDSIREAAGGVIAPRMTSTITLTGTSEQYLAVPLKNVRSIGSVSVDGDPVTDYRFTDGRLWRMAGWGTRYEPAEVVVTLDHGLDKTPPSLLPLIASLVGAGVRANEDKFSGNRGLQYVAIDDYREGYATGDLEVVDPTELPERTRQMLRDRYGDPVAVIGVY